MQVNRIKRQLTSILCALCVVLVFVSMLSIPAYAALTDSNIGVSITGNTDSQSIDGTKITANVSRGLFAGSKSYTITLTNNSGQEAVLSFVYSTDGGNGNTQTHTVKYYTTSTASATSVTLASNSTFKQTLQPGGKVELYASPGRGDTVKTTLTDISLKIKTSANVTFAPDATVSYNVGYVDGNGAAQTVAVAAGGSNVTVNAELSEGVSITPTTEGYACESATATTSGTIYADAEGKFTVVKDETVTPVFISSGGAKPFTHLGNGKTYYTLGAAVNAGSGTVALNQHYTLPAGEYTIPSGVTLLIPFDMGNTLVTNGTDNLVDAYDVSAIARTQFMKLTLADGAKIKVASGGAISISSNRANQFIGQAGPYGAIQMESGSNITVQNGGTLYAWGYIFHGTNGSGTVTVESGGTVYEPVSIMDYPGSTSLTTALTDAGVFPMRSYALRNVEVPMTLKSGAKEYAFSCLYGSNPLVGTNPLYLLMVANGTVGDETPAFQNTGVITKSYENSRMRMIIDGNFTLNAMTVEVSKTIGTVKIGSGDTSGLYIPSCYDMVITSGTTTLTDNVIMCEGSTLTINSGAVVNANSKNIYVLDEAEDPGAVVTSNGCGIDVQDVHGKYYTNVPRDAVMDINGTLIASGGFYTSTGGACITSSEGSGEIQVSGTSTGTAVNVKNTNANTSVAITAAKLKNADGTYINSSANTYKYCETHGNWYTGECAGCEAVCEHANTTTTTVDATCVAAGSTTVTCDDCGEVISTTEIPATGSHSYTERVTTAATCGQAGLKTFTCACGDSYTEAIPATGNHTYNKKTASSEKARDATCTAAAEYYVKCDNCDNVNRDMTVAVGNPLSHKDENTDHVCDNGCDVVQGTHADSATDKDHICDYCHSDEVLETCSGGIANCEDKATCSVCEQPYGEVNSANHKDIVTDAKVEATCTATGLTEGSHCEACGTVIVAQTTIEALKHNFDYSVKPTFRWAVDYNSCTAVFDCTRCEETESVTCTVSSNEVAGVDCQTAGTITYTATYEEFTDTMEIDGPVGEHRYSEEWTSDETNHWHKCTLCDATTGTETHDYTDSYSYEWSAENTVCTATRSCACGYSETETISGIQPVVISATCTQEGSKTWTAVFDAEWAETQTASETLSKAAHNMEHKTANDATCTETGNSEYWLCSGCGIYYKDAEGKDAYSETDKWEIEALGHDFTDKVEDEAHLVSGSGSNCQSVKQYYYDCSRCDMMGEETWNSETTGDHVISDQWTTENGKHFHKCTVNGCDHVADEADCVDGEDNNHSCDTCNAENISNHTWRDATCTTPKTCSVCGATEGDAMGHTEDLYENNQDGTHNVKCSVCNSVTASNQNHTYDSETHVCRCEEVEQFTITFNTNGGSEIATITQDYGTDVTAPADPTKEGHTFGGWDKEIPATMPGEDVTISANWTINTYTITWKNGGETVKEEKLEYGATVNSPADPSKEGYTFTGWDVTVPATMPANDLTVNATWQINSYKVIWMNGSEVYKEEDVAFGQEIVQPEAPTKETADCKQYTFTGWDVEIPATMPAKDLTFQAQYSAVDAHSWAEEVVYTWEVKGGVAACSATRVCSADQDHNVTVEATNIELVTDEASTCTTNGKYHYKATFENVEWATTAEQEANKYTDLPLAEHNIQIVTANPATCTEDGYTAHKACTVEGCGYKEDYEVIPAAHDPKEVEAKAATCYAEGNIAYWTCENCDKLFADEACTQETTADAVKLEKLAHTWGEGVVAKEATCTTAGLMDYECTVEECTATKTEVIDALNHSGVTAETEWQSDETSHWKLCPDCGEKVQSGEHSFADGVCGVCGYQETVEPDVYFKAIGAVFESEILLQLKFIIPDEVLNNDSVIVKMSKESAFDGLVTTEYTMAEVRTMQKDTAGRYVFVQNLASPELGRDVTIQFIDSNTGESLHIHDYSNNIVDSKVVRTAADWAVLALTKGNASQKLLAKGMLVYGGYAQQYFGIDAEEPIYNVLPELGYELPSIDGITSESITNTSTYGGDNIGIERSAEGPILDSAISHRITFTLATGHSIEEYSFMLTWIDDYGQEHTDPVEVTQQEGSPKCYLFIPDIASPYLDYVYRIQVVHNDSGMTYDVNTSVLCWVKLALQKSTNQAQINFAKAIYYYNDIANTYFNK